MRDNEFGDATGGAEEYGNEPAQKPGRASRPAGPPPEPAEEIPAAAEEPAAAEQTPDAGEKTPKAAELTQDTREKAADPPEAGKVAPKAAERTPDAGQRAAEQAPDAGKKAPKAAEQAPDAGDETAEQAPDAGKKAPKAAERTPDAGDETVERAPDAGKKAPKAAERALDAGEKAPKAAEKASGAAEQIPEAAFQPPMVVFQPPEIPKEPKPAAESKSATKPEGRSPAKSEAKAEATAEESTVEEPADEPGDEDGDAPAATRRRRRRGGRGRGKPKETAESDEAARAEAEESEQSADEESEQGADSPSTRRRRRRRRRAASSGDGEETGVDDPPNTVVHVREPRSAEDEVQSVKGSTRLEAKKQRRREGREQGRRRPPIVTESEFLARRESVERVMVIRCEGERTQIGVLEDNILVEHYVDRTSHQSYVGNVYLGKVQNVLPSMEAAFVDIGKGRNAVLYAGEVNWDIAGLEGQPRRIESALKSGQSVLVQVTKDPVGHKGARLTSQISLPGRYLVYVPDGSMTGISRKLPDKERTRLKQILKKVMPENAGVIVRTAAEGAAEDELSRDVSRLAAQWDNIKRQSRTAGAPAMLYGEPDLTIRVVRDIFNEDFARLVVQGDDAWDMVEEYVGYVAPHLADRLQKWTDTEDVFADYRIDEQIAKALERKVWLPSGGSLVIDRTEAMTVIDVNTGKFTGQGGNLEETVTRNNLEAAEEIVHQLRLRDLGGIIVIDFIDMVLESNRELVLRRMLECLARDRTKHQVAEVTSLGLVQMTRKRVGGGLLESFSEPCDACNGRGVHVTLSPVEPKQGAGGGRRRKRKGEVERAVEAKVARTERDKAVEVMVGADEHDGDASANGRRRRSRRPARAKSEATAD